MFFYGHNYKITVLTDENVTLDAHEQMYLYIPWKKVPWLRVL